MYQLVKLDIEDRVNHSSGKLLHCDMAAFILLGRIIENHSSMDNV